MLFLFKLLRDSLFYAWLWQIKEYRIDRMISYLKENRELAKNNTSYFIALALFFSYFAVLENYSTLFLYLVLALFVYSFLQAIKEIKNRILKRPVPTLKIAIIFLLLVAIYAMIALCWFYSSLKMTNAQYELRTSLLLLFVVIISPLIISSIVLAIEPIFNFQKKRIIKKATEKMKGLKKVKVIGITGSYGKTSTKEFLYAILSQKYKVVKTEGNNNTNIGVAYTVLNKVNDSYDYFICEMGAYKIGEIAEICNIVKPKIGILTGINEQHIDLFGSIKNTRKAKFELIEALPENGLAMISSKLKAQSSKPKLKIKNVKYFSLDNVDNIKVYQDYVEFNYNTLRDCHPKSRNKFGTGFVSGSTDNLDLASFNSPKSKPNCIGKYGGNKQKILKQVQHDKSDGLAKLKANLLGKHYIENLLSAIIVAEYLGMSLDKIKNGIKKIKPTEYMMRKLEGPNGAVFIDDSYSANFDGVIAALDYLDEAYKDFRKIIVFPGIIELGSIAEEVHKKLYNRIGKICDKAYILDIRYWILDIGKLGNGKIENPPLDKGELRRDKCKFVFEKDFGKVANMLKNDLDDKTVVLFESRGAGVVMRKFKVQS